jgi:hypothetical protein
LPPQRPSPNPGNGRPKENVRENYRAVVARAAGSSAMLGWAGPHCVGQRSGFRRSSTSWRSTSSNTVQTSDTAARAGTRRRG